MRLRILFRLERVWFRMVIGLNVGDEVFDLFEDAFFIVCLLIETAVIKLGSKLKYQGIVI